MAAGLVFLAPRVEGEDGHAAGDGRDYEVLVQRVALAEDGDVEEHHRQELARLGEDVGDVVDVGEGGVAERGGEGVGEGDEEERGEDLFVGDERGHGLAPWRGEDGEELAAEEGEEGLDCEEEDGELEALRGGGGAVGGGRELFLEVGPCEAGGREGELVVGVLQLGGGERVARDSQGGVDTRDIDDERHDTRVLLRDSRSLALDLGHSMAIGLAIGLLNRLVGRADFSASWRAVELAGVLGGGLAPERRGLLGAGHGGGRRAP